MNLLLNSFSLVPLLVGICAEMDEPFRHLLERLRARCVVRSANLLLCVTVVFLWSRIRVEPFCSENPVSAVFFFHIGNFLNRSKSSQVKRQQHGKNSVATVFALIKMSRSGSRESQIGFSDVASDCNGSGAPCNFASWLYVLHSGFPIAERNWLRQFRSLFNVHFCVGADLFCRTMGNVHCFFYGSRLRKLCANVIVTEYSEFVL